MSSRAATRWTCGICKNTIYWDELFTYTIKKEVVHYTCFRSKALQSQAADKTTLEAVLDMLEEELKMITKYKQKLNLVKDEETKKVFDQAEKDAEKNSAILTRLVEKLAGMS
jgi:hypothetical protein